MILTIIVYVFSKIVAPVIDIFDFVFNVTFCICRHIKGAFFTVALVELHA